MMKRSLLIIMLLLLAGLFSSCEKNLTGGKLDHNPNIATNVPMESLLSAIEVNSFLYNEDYNAWLVAMWMQQMAGTAMTFENMGDYQVTETMFSPEWQRAYGGGGLVDIHKLRKMAADKKNRKMEGVAKIMEAFFMGTTASLWGDIPYSKVETSDTPKLDKMSDVYNALQKLLDSAIEDLQSGQGYFIPSADHYYNGDANKWIALAHSLKARYYLEWAEVDPANYNKAMTEAQQGIPSMDDNFKSKHSETADEENCWYQLEAGRAGYVRAGKFLVDLLEERNDPRLEIYFGKDANGGYSGSDPGEANTQASYLNADTYGSKSWSSEFVTWEEMQFIIAEAQYASGAESDAIATLDKVLTGIEGKWGITLPKYSGTGITGDKLLEAIMTEKYIAMFTNMIVWSDWKRTGYPHFKVTYNGQPIPRRFLYPLSERNTNPNIPNPASFGIYKHNENDPN